MMNAPFGDFGGSLWEVFLRFLRKFGDIICYEFGRFLRKMANTFFKRIETKLEETNAGQDDDENAIQKEPAGAQQEKQPVTPQLRAYLTGLFFFFFVTLSLSPPPQNYSHQVKSNIVEAIFLKFKDKDSTKFPLSSLLTGTSAPLFILDIDSAMKKQKPDIWSSYQGKLSIIVPARTVLKVKLPDGTIVFLDSGSTLEFFKSDDNIPREIFLSGHAYFMIQPYLGKSPTVRCGNEEDGEIHISAVRASFYIRSYQSGVPRVSLVKDSAWITAKCGDKTTAVVTLTKGKEASLQNGMFNIRQFKIAMLSAWEKENKYMFNLEALGEVLKTAQEVYGISIVIDQEEIAGHLYTGYFDKNNSLDYFIERLCKSENLEYECDKDGIIHVRKSRSLTAH